MLKPFLLFSAAIFLMIASTPVSTLAGGGAGQDAAPASTNPVKSTAASQEKAKKLYAQDCAVCHGDNGNGKTDVASSMGVTLADWTDPKALADKSDQQLFDIIRKGKDKMPAEDAGRAKNDEIWSVVTFIRGLSKNQPAAPPAPAPAAPAPEGAPAPGH